MTHIAGLERDQLLLLPEAVDDYVGSDNPVRFIDAFVDGLDLTAAGFLRVEAKAMGRPGYAPGDLLKLYIYGYLNRVRSSRRLETECHRNIEVLWLLRTLKPDVKTIADFRRQSHGVSRRVPPVRIAVPTPRPVRPRVAGGRRNPHQGGQQQGSQLHPLFAARVHPPRRRVVGRLPQAARRGRSRTARQAAAHARRTFRTGEDQISLTDPDSRAMAAHTKVGVGYNVQVAVDATNKLIVEQAVTNQVVDMGLLTETSEPAREILGVETIDVVADRGYFKIEDIEACEQAGCVPHVAKPQRGSSVREGLLQGRVPIRRRARRLRLPGREVADADPPRPDARSRKDRLRQPESLPRVEHPFGSIKQWMYQGAFLMRGLANVRAEFSLTALAYNLRRALPAHSILTASIPREKRPPGIQMVSAPFG